jgi:hypothetical protein
MQQIVMEKSIMYHQSKKQQGNVADFGKIVSNISAL